MVGIVPETEEQLNENKHTNVQRLMARKRLMAFSALRDILYLTDFIDPESPYHS